MPDRPTAKERVAVVTGGTSGIGQAFVATLAARGMRVVTCGRDEARLQQLRETLAGVDALRADLTRPDEVAAFAAAVAAASDHVDLLAGVLVERQLDAPVDLADIETELLLLLTVPIVLTTQLLPLLRRSVAPCVVMVSSGYALAPATRAPVYSAGKAGLHAFTRAMRRQLAPGLRVVEVLPPVVDTPATAGRRVRKVPPQAVVEATLRAVARGRDEMLIGETRWLPALLRLAPATAARIVART